MPHSRSFKRGASGTIHGRNPGARGGKTPGKGQSSGVRLMKEIQTNRKKTFGKRKAAFRSRLGRFVSRPGITLGR